MKRKEKKGCKEGSSLTHHRLDVISKTTNRFECEDEGQDGWVVERNPLWYEGMDKDINVGWSW